jgi:hypothetical protein
MGWFVSNVALPSLSLAAAGEGSVDLSRFRPCWVEDVHMVSSILKQRCSSSQIQVDPLRLRRSPSPRCSKLSLVVKLGVCYNAANEPAETCRVQLSARLSESPTRRDGKKAPNDSSMIMVW